MTANQIIQCIDSIFKSAYKRQRLTLGLLVISVFKSERLTVTQMGRYLPTDTVPKHAIKRADRWLSTRRFDDKQAREQFLRLIVGTRAESLSLLIGPSYVAGRYWSPELSIGGEPYRFCGLSPTQQNFTKVKTLLSTAFLPG